MSQQNSLFLGVFVGLLCIALGVAVGSVIDSHRAERAPEPVPAAGCFYDEALDLEFCGDPEALDAFCARLLKEGRQ